MTYLTEVTTLLQQLLTQVASHSEIFTVLTTQRNNAAEVADSIASSDTDVPADGRAPDVPVIRVVDNPAPVQICEDQSKSYLFVTRELGNGIPILSDKKCALWKAHVLAYVRSNPEWSSGKAAVPEVLTSNVHPHGAALHSILWNKLTDTLKSQILLDEIGTAADLWKWMETEVAAAATESLHMLQQRLFKCKALRASPESFGFHC